jgi:uncharacterized membrane protein YidH (DUF202 family)
MKKFDFNIKTEKISQRVLYALVGLTALVFGAFYLIDFNRPSDVDPSFNDPLLTNVLILFMILLTVVAVVVGLWAMVRAVNLDRKERRNYSVSKGKVSFVHSPLFLSVSVVLLTLLSFLIFFFVGSSKAMTINGEIYNDNFWLKASDMFINTSLLMLVVAAAAMIFGATRYYRKEDNK